MGASDAVKLEGVVSTLTVIKPASVDLRAITNALRAKVEGLPDFFDRAPVAIDLCEIEREDEAAEEPSLVAPLALADLLAALRELGLVPVGIRRPCSARAEEARRLGLPLLRISTAGRKKATASRQAPQANEPRPCALTVMQPIRGGQVVYADSADAVVLSSVNAGGELIADGHVHVYGALRGRALAGAHGDERARIFCQSLEAELLSIAGVYLSADELPETRRGRPAQVYLDGESLVITDLVP